VLVRSLGWIDPRGWQTEDLSYMQTETQAALLGWIWSLSCPVVGRMHASIWYRPQVPITYWQPQLARCGLPVPEALVTNVEQEARKFGDRMVVGAVYGPFSTSDRYLIATDEDWTGLAALQRRAPVCLLEPHGSTHCVCIVGTSVVWDSQPTPAQASLSAGLTRFAECTGLNFVEFAVADISSGPCVVLVNPLPNVERYTADAQEQIISTLVDLLTSETNQDSPASYFEAFQRS
jgi:hypothetical protein